MAFELFAGGTASRGIIGSVTSLAAGVLTFVLQNSQTVVQFEVALDNARITFAFV